jgi:hypothetical protein
MKWFKLLQCSGCKIMEIRIGTLQKARYPIIVGAFIAYKRVVV